MKYIIRLTCSFFLSVCLLTAQTASAELKFPIGKDKRFHWQDLNSFNKMNLQGEKVRVFGPWLGNDEKLVTSVLAYFEKATGAKVDYVGSDSFEQQIIIDVEAGSPPNVAVFPQPGLAADVASKGGLTPLDRKTSAWIRKNYAAGQSWVDLGTFEDENGKEQLYGFFFKVDLKSLVWYSPENFEDNGYKVPKTMEQLFKLSDQMVADGNTPWCIGLGSGAATGWPATDWVEDIMLRMHEPSVYDDWVSNAMPFSDKSVVDAIKYYGKFVRNKAYTNGGGNAVAATDFRDSPKGLFAVPPQCFMHRQASFIPAFFPEGTELSVDADFFYFPPIAANKKLGNPVLGAGTLWAVTEDSKATQALMDFLKTRIANEIWMAQTGFLSAHKGVNLSAYANSTLRKQGTILRNATTFRFDGSDLMPGAVGAGTFWTGMVDYTSGKKNAAAVTRAIQKSWDSIK